MALVSEQIHFEALPVPDEPLLSWSIYLADTPAKWLGTVEAATPKEAIAEAAEKSAERAIDGGETGLTGRSDDSLLLPP